MTSTNDRLDDLLAELRRAPDGPLPTRKIAIVSTPRCGSKFFCESLASSGRFGRPLEWMNALYISAYVRLFGLKDVQLYQYLQFISAKTTSPNGVFAKRISGDAQRIRDLMSYMGASSPESPLDRQGRSPCL